MFPDPHRPTGITEGGRRNWDRLVTLAGSSPSDVRAIKQMADALAALLAEVTPVHREVISSQFARGGAEGRIRTWPIPPGMDAPQAAREKWAAIVFLDCVDQISDQHAAAHPLTERIGWRQRATLYTQGAENYRG